MNTQRHPSLARIVRTTIVVLLLIVLTETAVYIYPPLVMPLLYAVGRSPMCSPADAFRGGLTRIESEKERIKIKGLSRLVLEDPEGYQLWQTPRGECWVPKGSEGVLPVLLGQQAAGIYAHPLLSVGPGDIVLDCGAHIGLFSREAMKRGASLVVAVEPSPKNLECLRRNLKEEIGAGHVVVYPGGVWDTSGHQTLFSYDANTAADGLVIKTDQVSGTYEVPVMSIDDLAKRLDLPRIDFIKMDIKGSTGKALRGAKESLSKWRPRLAVSTEEEPDDPKEVTALISGLGLGYRTYCGTCILRAGFNVVPVVLFFSP